MNNKASEIKSQIEKLQHEVNQITSYVDKMKFQKSEREKEIHRLRKQHRRLLFDPEVSDHAIVKYFEHALGVNIGDVKKRIVNQNVIDGYRSMGDGKYPIGDSEHHAVIESGVVVTIVPNKFKK